MNEDSPQPSPKSTPIERGIETIIYLSRWLMAPIYVGLISALFILIFTFFRELWTSILELQHMNETDIILLVLNLIDLSLAGNLVLIILFSGYESFVSKIDAAHRDHDRPHWMGTLDFSGLKIKLISSIIAISGIHLLKIFMNLPRYDNADIPWYVAIHLTFIFSGVAVATMDWIEEKAHAMEKRHEH